MDGSEIINLISHATYVLLSLVALVGLIRHRDRVRLDVFLMFGAFGLMIVFQRIQPSLEESSAKWIGMFNTILLLAHPYLLLRLVSHMQPVPAKMTWFALVGMLLSWGSVVLLGDPLPVIVSMLIVIYFVFVDSYSAYILVRGAQKSTGVIHRRLLFAAAASGLIALLILFAGISTVTPVTAPILSSVNQIIGLIAGVFYFISFATPYRLRRIWQLEELYRFLRGTSPTQIEQNLDQVFSKFATAAQRAAGGSLAVVALWDREENLLKVKASSNPDLLPASFNLDHLSLQQAWDQRKSMLLRLTSRASKREPIIPAPDGTTVLFVVPIATSERAWGLLLVYLLQTPLFAQDDLSLLERLSEQTAVSLGYLDMLVEQQQLIDRLRRYNQRLEAIKEIDREILAARLPEKIAKVSLSHMRKVVPIDWASVMLFDHEKRQVQFLATEERVRLGEPEKVFLPVDDFADLELLTDKPILVNDTRASTAPLKIVQNLKTQGIGSLILVPLKADRRLIGALSLSAREPNAFEPEHQDIAREVASQLAITIQQAGLREELQRTNVDLEQRVVERTDELSKVVQELHEEIAGRQQASEALRAAQERLQFLLSATPAIIYSASSANKQQITFVSENALSQLGYEAKNFTENPNYWMDCIHPEDQERVSAYLAELPPTGHHVLEYRFYHKDGRYLWLHDEFRFICDDEGRPVEIVGYWIDNTKRRQAEDVIQNLNRDLSKRAQELQEANRELEAFAYSVSHDLRAPLRAIDGFSQVLMNNYLDELSPEAARYLHRVCDNTHEMGMLIDDLLSFSRINQQSLDVKPFQPDGIVRMALQSLAKDYEGREVEISIHDLPTCVGDPMLVKQVFANLLSNAIKFTSQRKKAEIEVGGTVKNGEAIYFVKDNGVGFDMQYAGKIFGVFQRLHRSEDYEGTGVGLAIVQRIVSRHGGRVWAEAEVDRGATFYFALPVP